MKRVTGLGGVFFKTADRERALAFYRDRLGMDVDAWGSAFQWREAAAPARRGYTVWSPFAADTSYFAPSEQPFMINLRVADLDGLLAELREQGVPIIGEVDEQPNGRFAWVLDPDGIKIELWEPIDDALDPYLPPRDPEPA